MKLGEEMRMKLKENFFIIKKDGINFLVDKKGKIKKFKPWLGDIFSFLYDRIMEKSIFPKKFNGDIKYHFEILKKEYKNICKSNVLEISTGSGNAVFFLNNDNNYAGVDISPGLLKRAYKRFREYGFNDIELFNSSAEELPFADNYFDFAICNLSMNFFENIELFIRELNRVLKNGSMFFCSVPVPERKIEKSRIRGTLYTEKMLKESFERFDFSFESKFFDNGALFYFSAVKVKNNN